MAFLSSFYPQPVVAGTTAGTYAEGNDSRISQLGAGSVVTSTGSTTARSLADRFSNTISVLDFGADPTGRTDSTTAIQAANDYCDGYQQLHFPNGTYRIKNTIEMKCPWVGQSGWAARPEEKSVWSQAPVAIVWQGPLNDPMVVANQGRYWFQMQNIGLMTARINFLSQLSLTWSNGIATITANNVGSYTNQSEPFEVNDQVLLLDFNGPASLRQNYKIIEVVSSNTFKVAIPLDPTNFSNTAYGYHQGKRPSHCLKLNTRLDSGLTLRNVWFRDANEAGVEFLDGGLNVNMRDIRFDSVSGYAIKIKVASSADIFSIDGFYNENYGSGRGQAVDYLNESDGGGGFLLIDCASVNPAVFRVNIANGICETNTSIDKGEGLIKIIPLITSGQSDQVYLSLNNANHVGGASFSSVPILIKPAHDGVKISLTNCVGFDRIVGLPIQPSSPLVKNNTNAIASYYAPNTTSRTNSGNTPLKSIFKVGTDFSASQYYLEGTPIIPIIKADPENIPDAIKDSPLRTLEHMWFFPPNQRNSLVRIIKEAATEGMIGVLYGMTGTMSGTTTLTINLKEHEDVTGEESTDTFNKTNHGFVNNESIKFYQYKGGRVSFFPPIEIGQTYYIVNATTDTFQIASTYGGTPITFTKDITDAKVSSVEHFKIRRGDLITIDGVVNPQRILTSNHDAGTFVLSSSQTFTDAALSFTPPNYRTHQLVPMGEGAPTATAPNGSMYLRTDGDASTTIYVRAGGSWKPMASWEP